MKKLHKNILIGLLTIIVTACGGGGGGGGGGGVLPPAQLLPQLILQGSITLTLLLHPEAYATVNYSVMGRYFSWTDTKSYKWKSFN